MTLRLLFCFVAVVKCVMSQYRPELIFHFNAPGVDRKPPELDIGMEARIDHLFARLVCRSPGNKLTVRIGPGDGSTELIDENMSLTNDSLGALSCMNTRLDNAVTCEAPNFCTLANFCVASLLSPCPRSGGATGAPKAMTYVDITVSVVPGGDLEVSRCFAFCQSLEENETDGEEQNMISNTAVGLIVAGAIALASLIIVALVMWKMKRHNIVAQPKA